MLPRSARKETLEQSKREENDKNRSELFTGDDPANIRQRKVKVQQTQDVTSSLLELRQLLQTQVESNATSVRALANSSTAIATTKTKMEGIGANMKTSDRLISKYESRERTDKVLIAAAALLFFGVVIFIIQKRLLGWIW